MKHFILIIILLTFGLVSFAQPAGNDRRLQADLRNLTRRVDTLKKLEPSSVNNRNENRVRRAIEAADKELAEFKAAHPDYDTSVFEKDINDFKLMQEESLENKDVESTQIDDFVSTIEEILDTRPEITKFLANVEGIVARTQRELAEYESKMNDALTPEFLELARNSDNRTIRNTAAKASRNARSEDSRLSNFNTGTIREITDENSMLAKYFEIQFARTRLNLLNRIFADAPEIQTAAENVGKLAGELGGFEELQTLARKNYAAKVARNRMYPEAKNDPALRAEFIRAFNGRISSSSTPAGSKIIRVHLIDLDWSVERNELTGIILSRDQRAHIAIQTPDNRCFVYLFTMEQKSKGTSYGPGFGTYNSESEILCENVPK